MVCKIWGIAFACMSVVFLFLTISGYQRLQLPPPKPAPLEVWLPDGAEVRPGSEIHPGTFYILLSAAEFRDRFPTGGIVSFPSHPSDYGRIEMWKPGVGGVFWKATQTIVRPTSWPWDVSIREVKLEGMELVAYPERLSVLPTAVCMIAAIGLAVLSVATLRRRVSSP